MAGEEDFLEFLNAGTQFILSNLGVVEWAQDTGAFDLETAQQELGERICVSELPIKTPRQQLQIATASSDECLRVIEQLLPEILHRNSLGDERLAHWFLWLSRSNVLALRFAATNFLYEMASAILESGNFTDDFEDEQLQGQLYLIYTGVFLERVRDIDPVLRELSVQRLGSWMLAKPGQFMSHETLSLVGLMVCDTSPMVRRESAREMLAIVKNPHGTSSLPYIYNSTGKRLQEVVKLDTCAVTRKLCASCIVVLQRHGYGARSDYAELVAHFFSAGDRGVNDRLAKMVWQLLDAQRVRPNVFGEKMEDSSPPADSPPEELELAQALILVLAEQTHRPLDYHSFVPSLRKASTRVTASTFATLLLDDSTWPVIGQQRQPTILLSLFSAWCQNRSGGTNSAVSMLQHLILLYDKYNYNDVYLAIIVRTFSYLDLAAISLSVSESEFQDQLIKFCQNFRDTVQIDLVDSLCMVFECTLARDDYRATLQGRLEQVALMLSEAGETELLSMKMCALARLGISLENLRAQNTLVCLVVSITRLHQTMPPEVQVLQAQATKVLENTRHQMLEWGTLVLLVVFLGRCALRYPNQHPPVNGHMLVSSFERALQCGEVLRVGAAEICKLADQLTGLCTLGVLTPERLPDPGGLPTRTPISPRRYPSVDN